MHRRGDFACANSESVTKFLQEQCPLHIAQNYCRVFILPNPDDPTEVWGYYSLSPSLLLRDQRTRPDQKQVPKSLVGLPAPMALIGYMGRHDQSPKGLGEALLVDAARRVHRNADMVAWGLMLDSERGPDNPKLWAWYQSQGFIPAKTIDEHRRNMMYGPLKAFLPELKGK